MSQPSVVALILAAGLSTRMGTCKAALPWVGGTTLLSYQIQQWRSLGVCPLVVLGPHNAELQSEIDAPVVLNPNPSAGKTSSILIGLQVLPPPWQVLAISAVDQPRPAEVYRVLLEAHSQQSSLVTTPTYQGRFGHPLLFAQAMLSHLQAIREETLGLRHLMETFTSQVHRVEFEAAIVLADLNTPERYHEWRQRWSEQ